MLNPGLIKKAQSVGVAHYNVFVHELCSYQSGADLIKEIVQYCDKHDAKPEHSVVSIDNDNGYCTIELEVKAPKSEAQLNKEIEKAHEKLAAQKAEAETKEYEQFLRLQEKFKNKENING